MNSIFQLTKVDSQQGGQANGSMNEVQPHALVECACLALYRALLGRRWVPGLPNLAKVVRTVDSSTAMINYLRTLPADEVPPRLFATCA